MTYKPASGLANLSIVRHLSEATGKSPSTFVVSPNTGDGLTDPRSAREQQIERGHQNQGPTTNP